MLSLRNIALFLCALFLFAPAVCGADHPEDASLRAVQFINANEGWAVGDEGVILHTINGGKIWDRQPCPTRASLRGMQMLDFRYGWVVGREELPTGGSVGVLLFTRDGGLKWQQYLLNSMPGLNRVHFIDFRNGYIFGDSSDTFATGIFRTKDGGASWEPVKGPRSTSWLAGDFYDGETGIFAGAWSRLATYRDGRFGTAEVDKLGGRHLHDIRILKKRALAVGQGGMVLTSQSSGARWGYAKLPLPLGLLADLDFHALHVYGDHVWVVGRPGSVVLYSDDQGDTWSLRHTGQSLPLNDVFFLDAKRGWAVGELGQVLATTDGGKSWAVQRQGGKRTAVLSLHGDSARIPLETLAVLGLDKGYLATAINVCAADPQSAAMSHVTDALRLQTAVRSAGGVSAEQLWQFALPQFLQNASKRDVLAYWNRLHGNRAEENLLRQLVLALRIWRPDAVVADYPADTDEKNQRTDVLMEAIAQAYATANDAKAFPDQIAKLGLKPWQPSHLFGVWPERSQAHVVIDAEKTRPRLEGSALDYVTDAARLLSSSDRPKHRAFRLLKSETKQKEPRHLLDMVTADGATRKLPVTAELNQELLQALEKRRNLNVLVKNWNDPGRTLGQLSTVLKELPANHAAAACLTVANHYARKGQWNLAREAYLLLVDRYPSDPASITAYRWLIRHISSSEARRRHELGQFMMVSHAEFSNKPGAKENPEGPKAVVNARLTYLANQSETRHFYRGGTQIAKRLAGFGPVFASDPGVQFCLQSSRRHLGKFDEASDWYKKFVRFYPKGPWHNAAAAELWLENRSLPQKKPAIDCERTATPPFLDGKLDDACWTTRRPVRLKNAVGKSDSQYPTDVIIAFDRKFMYVAVRCRHPKGEQKPKATQRRRDDDLQQYDRVSIMLDLDRDYATYFQVQVDQRGCVREDCWGDVSWNPRLFVAVDSNEDGWQAEIAIPLGELTGDRVAVNTAWACNIVRTLPGRGVQGWSLPADAEPRPEGMGLLMFKDLPQRK